MDVFLQAAVKSNVLWRIRKPTSTSTESPREAVCKWSDDMILHFSDAQILG